jgi:hypothetical protein
MFAPPAELVDFAEALEAADAPVPVIDADVVDLTATEVMVGVPDTAMDAADCLRESMSISMDCSRPAPIAKTGTRGYRENTY